MITTTSDEKDSYSPNNNDGENDIGHHNYYSSKANPEPDDEYYEQDDINDECYYNGLQQELAQVEDSSDSDDDDNDDALFEMLDEMHDRNVKELEEQIMKNDHGNRNIMMPMKRPERFQAYLEMDDWEYGMVSSSGKKVKDKLMANEQAEKESISIVPERDVEEDEWMETDDDDDSHRSIQDDDQQKSSTKQTPSFSSPGRPIIISEKRPSELELAFQKWRVGDYTTTATTTSESQPSFVKKNDNQDIVYDASTKEESAVLEPNRDEVEEGDEESESPGLPPSLVKPPVIDQSLFDEDVFDLANGRLLTSEERKKRRQRRRKKRLKKKKKKKKGIFKKIGKMAGLFKMMQGVPTTAADSQKSSIVENSLVISSPPTGLDKPSKNDDLAIKHILDCNNNNNKSDELRAMESVGVGLLSDLVKEDNIHEKQKGTRGKLLKRLGRQASWLQLGRKSTASKRPSEQQVDLFRDDAGTNKSYFQERQESNEEDYYLGGGITKTYSRTAQEPVYEDDDEEEYRKTKYEQYDRPGPPEDPFKVKHVEKPPPPPQDDEPYSLLEHYTPDGGVVQYERAGEWSYEADGGYVPEARPEKKKTHWQQQQKYQRQEKNEPEIVDNRRQRTLPAYSGGDIFDQLDGETEVADEEAPFDWVIRESLNILDGLDGDLELHWEEFDLPEEVAVILESASREASNKSRLRKNSLQFLDTLQSYLVCRGKMDAKYREIDEFQIIASHPIQTDIPDLTVSPIDPFLYKSEYQQQSVQGNFVNTLLELYEAAQQAKPIYEAIVQSVVSKLQAKHRDENVDAVISFCDLKGKQRAEEKAQDDYGKRRPKPGVSWLYDIVRGSVEFSSAKHVTEFLDLLQQEPSVRIVKAKNRFKDPSLTGYRDLNIQFQVDTKKGFYHICELQIHHKAIKELDEELHTHMFYEFFRSYFAGATSSLEERLEVLRLISDGGAIDDSFLSSLLKDSNDTERLERLGVLFRDQLCEYQWGFRVFVRLFDIYKEQCGLGHPCVARAYNDMALVLKEQGKLDEAIELYRESLKIYQIAYGDQHSTVANVYFNMALVLKEQEKLVESMDFFEQSLRIDKGNLGEKSLPVAHTYNYMATILRKQEKIDEAMVLFEKSLDIKRAVLEKEDWSIADTLQNIAIIMKQMGKLEESAKLFEESIDIATKSMGENHSSVAVGYRYMALVLEKQGKLTAALELYGRSLDIYKANGEEKHMLVADLYNDMAYSYKVQGKREKAMAFLKKSRSLKKRLSAERKIEAGLRKKVVDQRRRSSYSVNATPKPRLV